MSTPTVSDLFRVFGRIGIFSFGGPAAQIAVMHRELVEERPWLTEKQFLGALSFTMLLPGPEAMQLATWSGWKLGGTRIGLMAGLLFVLPGALVIAALALAYVAWGDVPQVAAAFDGIQALVVVIVVQALLKLRKKALHRGADVAIAVAAFAAIFLFDTPFPLIILAAAVIGALIGPASPPEPAPARAPVPLSATLGTVAIWVVLWMLPLAAVWLAGNAFLTEMALFFAKLAVVTFGGAYAVLGYMTQAVVDTHGWLTPDEMIDALGLAETTPGPLILVTQFTAMVAGAKAGGTGLALIAGALTLWMTFVPCFLWIFAFAPHLERLLAAPRLAGALSAITAAVTGVIADLSVWFAMHVVFASVDDSRTPPRPDWASIDPGAIGLIALGAVLLWGLRLGLLTALPLMALAGLGLHAAAG
ncbi:chromate efflux transporter [Pseudooceanicola sp. LIPI14-2-Ac024]|uniref:chromate efflux transporter n=1 Tax=Pseudooceanicola sp. LIPI14-2-Ac024 TaxID=3344875 RepID=UPI0035CEB648